MTKTQANLILDSRSRLDEPTAQHFTDLELQRWINQGARELQRKTETLQTSTSISTVASQQQYTAPANVIRIYRVEFIDTSNSVYALEYRDFNTMDSVWWSSQLTVTGRPMLYTLWGFAPALKIILYPNPDSSSTSIKVHYYRYPVALSETGSGDANAVVECPEGWEDIIVDYVEYMALRKDRDPRWQEAKALFEERAGSMYEMTRRWTDQAGMMDLDVGVPLHPYIWDPDY